MPDILHLALAIPGFALLLLAEVIFDTISKRELFETKDTFSSLAMGIGNVVVGLATKGVIFALYLWIYQFRIITLKSDIDYMGPDVWDLCGRRRNPHLRLDPEH